MSSMIKVVSDFAKKKNFFISSRWREQEPSFFGLGHFEVLAFWPLRICFKAIRIFLHGV